MGTPGGLTQRYAILNPLSTRQPRRGARMKTQTKLKLLRSVQHVFPIWALKWQSSIVYHAFESELKAASKNQDREFIEFQQESEGREFQDTIASIQSRRLAAEADNLFVYLPDLNWVQGQYGRCGWRGIQGVRRSPSHALPPDRLAAVGIPLLFALRAMRTVLRWDLRETAVIDP